MTTPDNDDKGKEAVELLMLFIGALVFGFLFVNFFIFLIPLAIVGAIIFFAFFQSSLPSLVGAGWRKVSGTTARLEAEHEARQAAKSDPPPPSPEDIIE